MKVRYKTYIQGLDEQMSGGIPKGHVVLVSGMPGTMKSSLCYNMLYHNAKNDNVKGLYISLEQSRESIIDHMSGLGMNHQDVEGLVNVVDMGYLRRNMDGQTGDQQSWMNIFKMYAENLHTSTGYQILVADSLPVLEILANVGNRRSELFHLFGWLRELGVTTLIIAESAADVNIVHEEDFLADGIIRLRKERQGFDISRQIIIDKMRGTKHNTGYFTLMHDGKNFQITRVIGE